VKVHARSFATHWSTFVIFSLRPYRKVEGHSNHFFEISSIELMQPNKDISSAVKQEGKSRTSLIKLFCPKTFQFTSHLHFSLESPIAFLQPSNADFLFCYEKYKVL
jgi:hypothetical protein